MLEKTLESLLDCKEIQPINPKGNQSWMFIGRTDAEAEAPILWPPDVKNWLIGKDPDAGKDWKQEEKGMTENKMVGWHHRLDGHEFGQAPGVGDGQGGLVCFSLRGCKESDTTEQLNWPELKGLCRQIMSASVHWWSLRKGQLAWKISANRRKQTQTKINSGEDVERREPSHTVDGNLWSFHKILKIDLHLIQQPHSYIYPKEI